MRVGLLGAGRIGALHAATLFDHPEVSELIVGDAAADRAAAVAGKLAARRQGVSIAAARPPQAPSREERSDRGAEQFNTASHEIAGCLVTAAPDVDGVFAAAPDALVIAAATAAHAELIIRGARAGVPIFCEKPIALDIPGTRAALAEVDTAGTPLQIGFQRRFDRGYQSARDAVHAGELGTLLSVHAVSADPAPPHADYVPLSGGLFRDMHIHDFDILRWVTGRAVESVYAVGANRGADFFAAAGDIDVGAAVLVLDDGTLVTLGGSRYNGAGYDIRMELAGTRATWVVGLDDRAPLRSAEPGVGWPGGPPWPAFQERFADAYVEELRAFVDVALGRADSPCTGAEALEALYVAEAAQRSRETGRPVRVEEVRG